MGSIPKGDKPTPTPGSTTVAAKQKRAENERERFEEARRRYNITRYYLEELSDVSYRDAIPLIEDAIEEGKLEGPAPSYATLWRWVDHYEEVKKAGRAPRILDFVAQSSSGRNRKPIHPVIEDFLHEQIVKGQIRTGTKLHKAAVKKAKEEGVPQPSEWQVRRYIEEFDIVEMVGGRYGRRAALIDAMPKGRLPTDWSNDVWMLDETRAPAYIRALDRGTLEWAPVKPWVILLMDVFSRLILSFWVVEPYKYGTEPTYTSDDVLGTLLGASFPAVAPDITQRYAGYLPRELRWDKHSTHQKLADNIRRLGIHVCEPVGESPYRQGRVERLNGTIKGLCDFIKGVDHAFQPVHRDTMKEDPKNTRSRAAGSKHRESAKQQIAVEDLHDVHSFREALAEQIQEYNEQQHSMLRGLSPEVAYVQGLDKEKARPGEDALLLMEEKVLTCTKVGVDHTVNGDRVVFNPLSVDFDIGVGDQLLCFADPLQRRLFVHQDGRTKAMMPSEDWARKDDYIGTVKDQQRAAAQASERGEKIRKQALEDEVGEEGVARAAEEKADLEEEEFPERREGVVERKRREVHRTMREHAIDPEELDEEGRRPRRRGLAGDPREQLRRSS